MNILVLKPTGSHSISILSFHSLSFHPRMESSVITWEGKVLRTPVCLPKGGESKYLTDFTEIDFIAMGGFGIVAKCKNNLDNKEYAVKKISLKYADTSFEKLLREVDALSSMKHQNIVQYYQAWIEPEMSGCTFGRTNSEVLTREDIESPCLYILMELCPSSLAEFICNTSTEIEIERAQALDVFCQILRGLQHIHGHGFVHGDLAPSNIFFDKEGTVKIGDFGLARKVEDGGSVVYSNSYANHTYKAPEKKRGQDVDRKTDIYSLGIILLELLHQFNTGTERTRVLEGIKKCGIPAEWMDEFTPLIERLISIDPTERPDVDQILGELEVLV